MANLFLTEQCRRNCSFCFAKIGPWSSDYLPRPLTKDEMKEFVDIPSIENIPARGVIGGEPLLHPDLVHLIQTMWRRGLTPKIFTSGTVPIPDLNDLEMDSSLSFVVNAHPPESYKAKEWEHLESFFQRFHKNIHLGYTLLDPDQDPAYIQDYIRTYKLRPFIRLGIAMPIAGGNNEYISQDCYQQAAARILDFAKQTAKEGISIGTDCGLVACMFTIKEIGMLQRLGVELNFACRPAIDVGPDLESWYCFPLARFPRVSLRKNTNLVHVHERFAQMDMKIREFCSAGIFERCENCRLRDHKQCSGGCLAMIVNNHCKQTGLTVEEIISGIEKGT